MARTMPGWDRPAATSYGEGTLPFIGLLILAIIIAIIIKTPLP